MPAGVSWLGIRTRGAAVRPAENGSIATRADCVRSTGGTIAGGATGLLVERSKSLLIQRGVDRSQGRKQTFVIDRLRRVANADHHAVAREQSAAAAADHRLPGHLQVPRRVGPAGRIAAALLHRIEETIERIDPAVLYGGIVAVVAADARHGITGTDGVARRGDAGNHHGTLRAKGHQSDVAFQVVAHQTARHADGRRGTVNVNVDLAGALRIAEEVSAGEHEGLAAGAGRR